MTNARVLLWGRQIGAVEWDAKARLGMFQYEPRFARSGIQLSPFTLPLSPDTQAFPALAESFHGLPGLLADSLPGSFGTSLIDAWLAARGLAPDSLDPVERLCYIGRRGMGALEFEPDTGPAPDTGHALDLAAILQLLDRVPNEPALPPAAWPARDGDVDALQDLLRMGTAAGGEHPKILLLWHPLTGEFRTARTGPADGFEHWLLKAGGADVTRSGQVEYACSLMARAAGIAMQPCRLHAAAGRQHFMTLRFDRTAQGKKLHMQSLAALRHFDSKDPDSYSYEQAMETIRRISAEPVADLEQQFLRAAFNVATRNQGDHVKNIAFLMWPDGTWRLSPAFDLMFTETPEGRATGMQQMSINGKRDDFILEDIEALARTADIKPRRMKVLVDQVLESVRQWPAFALAAGVSATLSAKIAQAHR